MVSVVGQSTDGTFTGTRHRLVYFVVNTDGMLIALYNDMSSAVIKLKNVNTDSYEDWHLIIRPQVGLVYRAVAHFKLRRSCD